MPRHPDDDVYCVTLRPEEQDFADHMMAMVGLTSRSDFLRLGLWHHARHLDVPIGNQIFRVGEGNRARRTAEGPSAAAEAAAGSGRSAGPSTGGVPGG